MINKLLTTTAVALLLATPVFAQANTTAAPAPQSTMAPAAGDLLLKGYTSSGHDFLASDLMGEPVYTSSAADAETIGNIKDAVLDNNGQVAAVVIEVGGFLGIGDKSVAVDMAALHTMKAEDGTARWVLETTKDALNTAPAFDWNSTNSGEDVTAVAATPATNVPAATQAAPVPATDTAQAPMTAPADPNAMKTEMSTATETSANPNQMATPYDAGTMQPMGAEMLTADNLKGTKVVGPENEQIAEVGDVLLTQDGKVDALLVDFGGFLGIGEKRVAVAIDNLDFRTDENGNKYVWLNVTKDQLNAAPAYDEASYAAQRDTQRMMINPS